MRRLMDGIMANENVRIVRMKGSGTQTMRIPCDFEPACVLVYDEYPADNFVVNSNVSFEYNAVMPIMIIARGACSGIAPYSINNGTFRVEETSAHMSFKENAVEITSFAPKKFCDKHNHTVVLIKDMPEEVLTP